MEAEAGDCALNGFGDRVQYIFDFLTAGKEIYSTGGADPSTFMGEMLTRFNLIERENPHLRSKKYPL
ncbi:MAG: hypothetical protein V3V26_01170 [Candidatus Aenigmarchaeota archaeon]